MFKKLAAAAIIFSALATQAQAATTWTVTTTGLINYGYDARGVFGVVGQNLSGLEFTQSITVNLDGGIQDLPNYKGMLSFNTAFSDSVTINGRTLVFDAIADVSTQTLQNGVTKVAGAGAIDEIRTYQQGKAVDGRDITATNRAFSYSTAFVPTLDFGQAISQLTPRSAFGSEASFSYGSAVYFSGYTQSIAVTTLAVPEPETYAMMLVGLGLVGAIARRRSSKT